MKNLLIKHLGSITVRQMIRRHKCSQQGVTEMTLEVIVALQGDGMKARAWGLSSRNNPALIEEAESASDGNADWRERHDAWLFGWEVEDVWLRSSQTLALS
jgi:hypothetical protein